MNDDRMEGNWKQFKGKVKEQWGKLTDDDLDVIAGRRDQLLGRIQQRHGIARDDADRQVQDWERSHPGFRLEDTQPAASAAPGRRHGTRQDKPR